LEERCITTLPDACTDLANANGLELVADVAICAVALGPFAAGSAATCLSTGDITGDTTGTSIVECLEIAFGLASGSSTVTGLPFCDEPTTTPTPTPTPTPQPACFTMPEDCAFLGTLTGSVAIGISAPACRTALGNYNTGTVPSCFTSGVGLFTSGTVVTNCLNNALSGTCISTLPAACSSLAGQNTVQLALNLDACNSALGPFGEGDAEDCLSVLQGSGDAVVSCLNNALFFPTTASLAK
jgi:hypothetical protein